MDEANLKKHLDSIQSPGDVNPKWKGTADTMHAFARFLADISDEQAQSAAKMERQTEKIIKLTWGLFWLTFALSFVAAIQLYIMLK